MKKGKLLGIIIVELDRGILLATRRKDSTTNRRDVGVSVSKDRAYSVRI